MCIRDRFRIDGADRKDQKPGTEKFHESRHIAVIKNTPEIHLTGYTDQDRTDKAYQKHIPFFESQQHQQCQRNNNANNACLLYTSRCV